MYRIPKTLDKVWEVLKPIKNNEETVSLLQEKKVKGGEKWLLSSKSVEKRRWTDACRSVSQRATEMLAHLGLWLLYTQFPGNGASPDV